MIRAGAEAVSNSKELYILGYSIPEADAIPHYLLTNLTDRMTIKIIDLNANEIANRLKSLYPIKSKNLIVEEDSITDWIQRDFEFQKHKEWNSTLKSMGIYP